MGPKAELEASVSFILLKKFATVAFFGSTFHQFFLFLLNRIYLFDAADNQIRNYERRRSRCRRLRCRCRCPKRRTVTESSQRRLQENSLSLAFTQSRTLSRSLAFSLSLSLLLTLALSISSSLSLAFSLWPRRILSVSECLILSFVGSLLRQKWIRSNLKLNTQEHNSFKNGVQQSILWPES